MRSANKPALADAIWALMPKYVVGPTGQGQYVLDGGSLVHRIPWQRSRTGGRAGPTVDSTRDMVMKCKKEILLSNKATSYDSLECYIKTLNTLDAKDVVIRVVQRS